MDAIAPLALLTLDVEPAWIDYNGHLNVGYFVVAFDRGTDELIDRLGMDAAYRARSACTVYVLELHVSYEQEVMLEERIHLDAQLIDADAKRLHYFLRMLRDGQADPAATAEVMLMHVDGRERRGAPMPEEVQARVADLLRAHSRLPHPPQVGRRIGIRRRAP